MKVLLISVGAEVCFIRNSINPVAGYAVDGNTDGYFLNKSTTHTEYAQGAYKLLNQRQQLAPQRWCQFFY
jgi:hypothetical protein